MCKTLGGHLAEFEEKIELKQMAKFLGQSPDKGKEFWLGGLNPGLLWIWSNSARPINANTNLTLAATSTKLSLAANQKSTDSDSLVQKVKRDDKTNKKQFQSGGTANSTTYDEIKGSGRCLRLSYNAKKERYQYSGTDCSALQFYLCEFEDNSVENEIDRVSKALLRDTRIDDERDVE